MPPGDVDVSSAETEATEGDHAAAPTRWRQHLALSWRADWLFLVMLAVAAVMRVLVTLAFRPGLELYGDSYSYLANAEQLWQGGSLHVGNFHPVGYPVFLWLLTPLHYTLGIVLVQHALGLAVGAATYFAVRRLTTRPWIAAIAAAPVLLDGYQLDIEQFILSDTFFLVLVIAACLLILIPERPTLLHCVFAGLLIGMSTITRGLGLAVLLPLAAYALARRFGWRRVVALGACAVLPVLGYMVRYHQTHGEYALESTDGLWLYGRTAYFADCSKLPASEQDICPGGAVSQRLSPEIYTWSKIHSPLYLHYPAAERPKQGKKFAYAVIKAQPLSFLRTTMDGLVRDVAPVRTNIRWAWDVHSWQMGTHVRALETNTMLASRTISASRNADRPFPAQVKAAWPARFTGDYEKVVWTWGPTLVLALLLVVLGLVFRTRSDRRVWVAAAFGLGGLLLMVVPALTEVQDYRYMLPVQAMLWPAGALAADALLGLRSRRTAVNSTPVDSTPVDPAPTS